ncbi:MAG: hypothetical protein J6Q53_04175 [Oscillospiraceae bacterium]|nr:hypothetical protein [Oscillospiraceae bacterium]
MANEKLISQISTIQRALGIIEGVTFLLETVQANEIIRAIDMIDEVAKELLEDGQKLQ